MKTGLSTQRLAPSGVPSVSSKGRSRPRVTEPGRLLPIPAPPTLGGGTPGGESLPLYRREVLTQRPRQRVAVRVTGADSAPSGVKSTRASASSHGPFPGPLCSKWDHTQ